MEGELLQNSVEPLVNEDNVDSEEELQQSLNLFKQFLGYAFCNVDSRITRLLNLWQSGILCTAKKKKNFGHPLSVTVYYLFPEI